MLTGLQKKRISEILTETQEAHAEVTDILAYRQEQYNKRSSKWQSGDDGIFFNDQLVSLGRAAEGLERAVDALGDLDTE